MQQRQHDDLLVVRRSFARRYADYLQANRKLDEQVEDPDAGEDRAAYLGSDESEDWQMDRLTQRMLRDFQKLDDPDARKSIARLVRTLSHDS